MSDQFEGLPAAKRMFADGRKKILSLDGGGVRGMITIAFLQKIEQVLRQESGKKDLVLKDYFDLVGGTSVGSLLATMIALGLDTKEIHAKFKAWAPEIFRGRDSVLGIKRFDGRNLVQKIQLVAGEETLGSDKLQIGLAIVAKRVDTGSAWIMTNNPRGKFYDDKPGKDGWLGNRHYRLWSILRASTAAPFYYNPTRIPIAHDAEGNADEGLFVDGGVSPHNNPALQLFLMASLPSHELKWPRGPEQLQIISIGAGTHRTRAAWKNWRLFGSGALSQFATVATRNLPTDLRAARFAAQCLRGMVADGQNFGLAILQGMSHPRFSWRINAEIGDLAGETFLPPEVSGGLLRFQRYDVPLEEGLLPERLDIVANRAEREKLFAIDEPKNLERLWAYGVEAAEKQVSREDFQSFL